MSVYFSEKFKNLRKSQDLTQDQIADIFHVSPQSVSRWENGANYPDVDILPHIAIFFNVTVDELLGTEAIRGEEKANEYIRDIRNLLNSGKVSDAIDLAHKATKEYPVNGNLPYHLLHALITACSGSTPEAKENTEKFKSEIISVGERVTNNDPNNFGVKIQLIEQYAAWGMKEEAKKILGMLPSEIWYAEEINRGCILEGDEWRRNQLVRIVRISVLLAHFIGGCTYDKGNFTPLEKIEFAKARMQIESLIASLTAEVNSSFHDDGEGDIHLDAAFTNIHLAELYCEAGDIINSLDCVEKATQESMYHIDIMDKTNADGSNYFAWSTPRNLPWMLWEDNLMKPQFDIIRNDERFIKCFEQLKANSKELK